MLHASGYCHGQTQNYKISRMQKKALAVKAILPDVVSADAEIVKQGLELLRATDMVRKIDELAAEKLPILFVIKGQPGGHIDNKELPTFPSGHYYAMQSKAWMDAHIWRQYLWWVLAERVTGRSLLVLDNFDAHVSEEGVATAAEIGYDVCPLPPNATSHCQPLDVSIMTPFKHHLHDLWIAEDTIEHDEEDDQDWMSHTAHVKRTTMIKRAIMAWEKITPEQVRASFLKAIPKPD
ncbi:hypothetical protein DYB34_010111 [Aphanomyces astaci]|uniref:DDE-1 domain-containing protein n=1 Tax=Aphanomyces astaci TaxID=112090 RepID=A0A418CBR6_APHAT|nr:hypothetical protein DYB34_010111 [Aphanomyces astaci]